jgi:hypothetical protein
MQRMIAGKRELRPGSRPTPFPPRPFEKGVIRPLRLMTINKHEWLLGRAQAGILPVSWKTLYELTKLDNDDLDNWLGRIAKDFAVSTLKCNKQA